MDFDVIVIGGGIVGLATALRLVEARSGIRLALLEKEDAIARHQTGNNSGVIHSGLYYKPGSLKAINCREGYRQLLEFCRSENIPHEICGKIVVAISDDEVPRLEELHRRGVANGLEGIHFLGPQEIREIEPHCAGVRGLYVPQTGIVDFVAVAEKYAAKISAAGGRIMLGEKAETIRRVNGSVEVVSTSQTLSTKFLVTCGGLHSDRLARQTQPDLPLRIIPFRGEYYLLKPEAHGLVRHLIYPVPDPAFPFLGVHFTRMIGGGVECGPNAVFAFAREGYHKFDFDLADTLETFAWPGFRRIVRKYWRAGVGEFRRSMFKSDFVRALQKLIPEIRESHLEPGGAGIRAQACTREGQLIDDFHIVEDNNIVHVCNAPSPAATSSLAIGRAIASGLLPKL
jgi:L-2-hydroxyglutarate oxidase